MASKDKMTWTLGLYTDRQKQEADREVLSAVVCRPAAPPPPAALEKAASGKHKSYLTKFVIARISGSFLYGLA